MNTRREKIQGVCFMTADEYDRLHTLSARDWLSMSVENGTLSQGQDGEYQVAELVIETSSDSGMVGLVVWSRAIDPPGHYEQYRLAIDFSARTVEELAQREKWRIPEPIPLEIFPLEIPAEKVHALFPRAGRTVTLIRTIEWSGDWEADGERTGFVLDSHLLIASGTTRLLLGALSVPACDVTLTMDDAKIEAVLTEALETVQIV